MIADEKGFEFHAQPQTGAYSCLKKCKLFIRSRPSFNFKVIFFLMILILFCI